MKAIHNIMNNHHHHHHSEDYIMYVTVGCADKNWRREKTVVLLEKGKFIWGVISIWDWNLNAGAVAASLARLFQLFCGLVEECKVTENNVTVKYSFLKRLVN